MVKIAIVENLKAEMQQLIDILDLYAKEKFVDFSTDKFVSGEEFFDKKTSAYDIIFLDIMLPGMNGIEIAKQIRKDDAKTILIFVTSVSNFAVEGYTVGALDYVVKPVKNVPFFFTMDRAVNYLRQREKVKIGVDSAGGIQILSSEEITYIEVFGHSICYHLGYNDQQISEWAPLSKPEKILSDHGFFRCSKYYLVNLKYIEKIQGSEIIVCGKTINVSKNKLPELKDKLNQYLSI